MEVGVQLETAKNRASEREKKMKSEYNILKAMFVISGFFSLLFTKIMNASQQQNIFINMQIS